MALDWASSTLINNQRNAQRTPEDEEDTDDTRPALRSIPPWVITTDAHDKHHAAQPLLRPTTPVIPHHQYLPESQRGGRAAKGRRWDHLRNAEPALLDQTLAESSERWKPFMLSGPQYRPDELADAQAMSDSWMEENVPYWSSNYDTGEADHVAEKHRSFLFDPARRRGSVNKAKNRILKNPFVPLVFRVITAIFSLCALGLGARVYHQTRAVSDPAGCTQRASTYIAIVVDTIAVPYIIYITRDEYTSKPLGLRSATAKTSLLLIDLYFIVFYSSNLSLAFDALTDTRWACFSQGRQTCPADAAICSSQSGLTAVLLVALVAWLVTFSISVLRVVKRLRPDE